MSSTYFVFDVESVGLHGEGFSVGYVVLENGDEAESGYYRTDPETARGTATDYAWIMENVAPHMQADLCCTYGDGLGSKDAKAVREAFWNRWMVWKSRGAVMVADCPWPVEARFLIECVNDDPAARKWDGPYPFIDVASVRLAAGLDPLGTNERLEDEKPIHHPLADARQSARLLLDALSPTRKAQP